MEEIKKIQVKIGDYIREEDKIKALKAYYAFFNVMYGNRRLSFLGKDVDYTMNPTKFVDRYDANLQEAIKTVKQANNSPIIKVIILVDENDNTIALARFKVTKHYQYNNGERFESFVPIISSHSMHLGDMVFLDVPPILVVDCYKSIISAFEEYAISNNVTNLSMETLQEGTLLKDVALDCGYNYDESYAEVDRSYRTIILDKKLQLEKGEDFGRNRTRK